MPVELLSDLARSWAALVLNHQLSVCWQNNGAGSSASSQEPADWTWFPPSLV